MTTSSVATPLAHQAKVNDYFDAESPYWEDLYVRERGVVGQIIRDRHATVLQWVEQLGLAVGSPVLELGCGAGYLARELAGRGFRVHAVDSSEAMVNRARRNGRDLLDTGRLIFSQSDAHDLPFAEGSWDLVVAIGVIAWIDNPEQAVAEMARVVKPGGYVLLTSANMREMRNFLDPWRFPPLRPVKLRLKKALELRGIRHSTPSMTFHYNREVDAMVEAAGLHMIKSGTVGFGPFSVMGRPVLPARLAIRLHRRLQNMAGKQVPMVRFGGMSYLVLGQKPE